METILQTPPQAKDFKLVSEDWHKESIRQTLSHWDGKSDLWVFGYGSLIWRPEFDFIESHIAEVQGYHRALCLWSRVNRGTPEIPGLVFGLDTGGRCKGKVFRIAGREIPQVMRDLWIREMPSASYIPAWVDCQTDSEKVQALVFKMDQNDTGYVPDLSLEQTVQIVRQGHGKYGACTDYVLETARALEIAGIIDPELQAIAQALTTN